MRRFAITLAALALAACGGSGDGNSGDAGGNAAQPQAAANGAAPSGPPPVTPRLDNLPAADNSVLAPPSPAPEGDTSVPEGTTDPGSAEAAADVVRSYYSFLDAGRYAEAYRLREPQPETPSAQQFAAGFARYGAYHGTVGEPGRVDSGAGQRFVTVPVKVAGTLKDGGPFALAGDVVLHRTGDIDGATAEQRHWRIRSADLSPQDALPATADARYRCIDGTKMAAHFDNGRNTVTITRADKRLATLTQQRAASGIWYKGAGYELRGKGRDATFTQPGLPPMPCRAISSR